MKNYAGLLAWGMITLLSASAASAAQNKQAPLYLDFWTLDEGIAEPVELTIKSSTCPKHFTPVEDAQNLCGRNVMVRVETGFDFDTHAASLKPLQYRMHKGRVRSYLSLPSMAAGSHVVYHITVHEFSDALGLRLQPVGTLGLMQLREEDRLVDVAIVERKSHHPFMAEARDGVPSTKHVWCKPASTVQASL